MKKQSKWIIGVVAVVLLVGAALIFSNTGLFKGSLPAPTYSGAKWQCYDGTSANKQGAVCKTSADWSNDARTACANKCSPATRKCGVNSFSVSNSCRQAAPVVPQEPKLIFNWVVPASATLITGNQVEVGRFTLSAASSAGPLTVNVLSFMNQSTAGLTNFALKDLTLNTTIASNANSSTFTGTPAGGNRTPFNLQQGETRTFVILADVATRAPHQVAMFKVRSMDSIGWVANNVVKTQIVLPNNAADSLSTTLTAAAVGSDTTPPRIIAIALSNGGVQNKIDVGDAVRITFSEKIDPIRISQDLTYGGTVMNVPHQVNMGGMQLIEMGGPNDQFPDATGFTTMIQINSIARLTNTAQQGRSLLPIAGEWDTIVSESLSQNGTQFTVTITGTVGDFPIASDQVVGPSIQLATTLDTARNEMVEAGVEASPRVTGSW